MHVFHYSVIWTNNTLLAVFAFSPHFNLKMWAIASEVRRRLRQHLLVGALTCKLFHVTFPNLLCMLLMTSSIMAKKIQNSRFFAIYRIFRRYFDLVGKITWKVFHVSSSNLLYMLLISSSWTSSIMAEQNFKMADLLCFLHFTSIIWPCGHNNLKSFLCMLFKFVMHVANKQLSDKFNNYWKKI